MDIETMLHDEIKEDFEALRSIEVGSEEFKTTVDGITKLVDRAIEMRKSDDEKAVMEVENNIKLKQMEDDRKDRFVKNCISVSGILIPIVVTIWGTCKSLKFEETGTVTTIVGRGFINKLLPKK